MDPSPTVSTSSPPPPSQYDYEPLSQIRRIGIAKKKNGELKVLPGVLLTGFVFIETEFFELERALNYLPKFKS